MRLSWVNTEYSIHGVLHTWSTAYTQCCIHRVLQHPKIKWLPLPASLISRQTLYYSTLYIPTITSKPMDRVSAAIAPPSRSTASRLTTFKYSFNLNQSWPPIVSHQQRPQFPSETPGCSRRLWRLWRNLVRSDGELIATRRPGDGSRCIRTSFTLWWSIRIIRMTRVLHSSQGLQLCWSRLDNAWQSTKNLGAPRITVMYSVCILIYVSMYLYSYPSTHAISGLAAVYRIYTPCHPVHLRYPSTSVQPQSLLGDILDRARLRCTSRRRLSELRDSLGGWDRVNSEMH